MRVFPLRTSNLPDLADHVIHFTGRAGKRAYVDPEIAKRPAEQRLLRDYLEMRVDA